MMMMMMTDFDIRSSNQMHDMDRLIRVCKAMPGFCKRSRTLSRFARKAIIEAIVRSGQPVPVITQRHIDSPRIVDISDDDRLADSRPQTIECQAINQRSLYEVHVASEEGSHARSALAVPNLTDVNQRMQVMDQQRQADTRLGGQQGKAAREASSIPLDDADDEMNMMLNTTKRLSPRPVAAVHPASGTARQHIDFPDVGTASSGEHDRSTVSDLRGHQTSSNFTYNQSIDERTQEVPTTEYSSMPEEVAVLQQTIPQWQTNAEIDGHQLPAAQQALFGPSPDLSHSMRAALACCGNVAPQSGATGAATYAVNHAQFLAVDQRYDGWDGTFSGSQSVMFDPELWCSRFSN
jgi:hypothetical protein